MSAIRSFTTFFKQAFHHEKAAPDPNDIRPYHDIVDIRRLGDIPAAARTIIEHAGKRGFDDRIPGKISLMVYAPLSYQQWFELTREVAIRCPASLQLATPTYSMLRTNNHQQFVFNKRADKPKRISGNEYNLKIRTDT